MSATERAKSWIQYSFLSQVVPETKHKLNNRRNTTNSRAPKPEIISNTAQKRASGVSAGASAVTIGVINLHVDISNESTLTQNER